MSQEALNFILFVLPNLPKIIKDKNKTKGKNRVKYQIMRIIPKSELDDFKGIREYVINDTWEYMYYEFKKRGISPSHYERYESRFGLHLRLETIEEVDDWELKDIEQDWKG